MRSIRRETFPLRYYKTGTDNKTGRYEDSIEGGNGYQSLDGCHDLGQLLWTEASNLNCLMHRSLSPFFYAITVYITKGRLLIPDSSILNTAPLQKSNVIGIAGGLTRSRRGKRQSNYCISHRFRTKPAPAAAADVLRRVST